MHGSWTGWRTSPVSAALARQRRRLSHQPLGHREGRARCQRNPNHRTPRRVVVERDEALTVGALGFSTTFMDTDRANREVPSRKADDAESVAVIHHALSRFVE